MFKITSSGSREPGDNANNYGNNNTNNSSYAEFERLRDLISTNIYSISSNATSLDKALKTIGTGLDSKVFRLDLQGIQTSCKVTITHTTSDLKKLKALTEFPDEMYGKEKLILNRLEKDFRSHVERYMMTQKKVLAKIKVMPLLPKQSTSGTIGDDDSLHLVANEETEYYQTQIHQTQAAEFDLTLALETATRVQQIERDIVDIHEIMTELGSMVQEQGEVIDTIEENIENAHVDVEAANQELHQAAKLQTSKRKCLLGITIAGLLVVIILVIIVVTELKR